MLGNVKDPAFFLTPITAGPSQNAALANEPIGHLRGRASSEGEGLHLSHVACRCIDASRNSKHTTDRISENCTIMIGYAFSSHDAKFIAHESHVVCILNRPHFGCVALLERKRVHHPDSPKLLQQDGPKRASFD